MRTKHSRQSKWQIFVVLIGLTGLWNLLPLRHADALITPIGCGPVNPNECTLAELNADKTAGIIVGDKLFNNFVASVNGGGFYIPFNINQITVAGETVGDLEGFQIQGLVEAYWTDPYSWVDLSVTYDVSALEDWLISDIHLVANIDIIGHGSGHVTEHAYSLPGVDPLCSIRVDETSGPLGRTCYFPEPQSKVHITKDMAMRAWEQGADAFFSVVEQLVSQVPPEHRLPEPSTLLLLGTGLIGVAVWGRKRYGDR